MNFTCHACECSYMLKPGDGIPVKCDRCGAPVTHSTGPATGATHYIAGDIKVSHEAIIKEAAKYAKAEPQGSFTKNDDDKLAWDLLPPEIMEGIVRVLMSGAKKYPAFNWQRGTNYSRYYNAAMRHLSAFWQNENTDEDSGLHHLDHAMCCLVFLRYFELYPDEYAPFDNRLEGHCGKDIQGIESGETEMPKVQEVL